MNSRSRLAVWSFSLVLLLGPWADAAAVPRIPKFKSSVAEAPPSRQPGDSDAAVGTPAESADVHFDGDKLFTIYGSFDVHGVQERARIAEQTILRLAQDPFYSDDLFSLSEQEDGVRVYYRGSLVGFVSSIEAKRQGKTAPELAVEILDAVQAAVERYHERREPEAWNRAIFWVAVCTVGLVAALLGIRWLGRWIDTRLEARAREGVVVAGQRLPFFESRRLAEYQERILALLRLGIGLLLVLAYLQIAFSLIPITRGYAYAVLSYLLDPLQTLWLGFLANVGGLFFILVMVVLARFLLRAMRRLMQSIELGRLTLRGVPRDRARPLYKILRLVVIALTAVVIYPYVPGSSSAAFQGVSIFAGALFTLGASGAASNFVGGVVLIFTSAYQVGDRVKIGDVTGDVEETTLVLTRLRTPKNELVTLANSTVLSSSFVNYSTLARREGLILHTSITIGYDVSWRRVRALMLEAAHRTPDILESPTPFVLQKSLNDFHVSYELNAYTREANAMSRLYSDLHGNLRDVFDEAEIEILSPEYTSLRDGRESTVAPTGEGTSSGGGGISDPAHGREQA